MKHNPSEDTVSLPDATPDDARALAELIGIAVTGIPQWLCSTMTQAGESVIDVQRATGKADPRGLVMDQRDGRHAR